MGKTRRRTSTRGHNPFVSVPLPPPILHRAFSENENILLDAYWAYLGDRGIEASSLITMLARRVSRQHEQEFGNGQELKAPQETAKEATNDRL